MESGRGTDICNEHSDTETHDQPSHLDSTNTQTQTQVINESDLFMLTDADKIEAAIKFIEAKAKSEKEKLSDCPYQM